MDARETFRNDVKTGLLKCAYLFFGEETALIKHSVSSLKTKFFSDTDLNVDIFEGKASVATIADVASTLPFLSERRLVIVKDSGLFSFGRKDDTEFMAEFIKNFKETGNVILFLEQEVDKRNKLYKRIGEVGLVVEFTRLNESELCDWVQKSFQRRNRRTDMATALYLIRTVGNDMVALGTEIEKLTDFCSTGLVTPSDIDAICRPTLEQNVFRLIDAASKREKDKALHIYRNMLTMKEEPIVIAVMLARQLRITLQAVSLNKQRFSESEIASRLGLRSFMVRDCLKLTHLSEDSLISGLQACLETDIAIKSGALPSYLAVEMLILTAFDVESSLPKGAATL